ncbi:MAG TPA: hypothetical protein PK926_17495 [Spirochaetota bacterium]|nr:hypothetical protein [Spirochaetota bacterium]
METATPATAAAPGIISIKRRREILLGLITSKVCHGREHVNYSGTDASSAMLIPNYWLS